MEPENKPSSSSSEQNRAFWEAKGFDSRYFEGQPGPSTESEIQAAEEPISFVLVLLHDINLVSIRRHIRNLSTTFKREGRITEEQHMRVFEAFERLVDGKTTEERMAIDVTTG